MKSSKLRTAAISFVLAAVLTASAWLGLLYSPDSAVADALYQRPRAQDGIVAVVAIDQYALEQIGPMPWTRDVMAQVVRRLNANENARPAVIGIDVLYIGQTQPEYDDALIEAAREGGNVVLAEAAEFSEEVKVSDGRAYIDRFSIVGYDRVLDRLRAVTEQGHINAMLDRDGVLRHWILKIEPDGEKIYSFSRVIYEKYCRTMGIEPTAMPETDGSGFFYLPYSARPGDFSDGVSVADILSGAVPGEFFADRIVLIGPYAAGLQDQYITPIERSEPMYGIEIQANAISAYFDGRHALEAKNVWQLILMFAVSFGAMWFFLTNKLGLNTAVFAVTAAVWIGICLAAWSRGTVLHPLWIPLADVVLYVISVAINYIRAAIEKMKVTNTFKRYVDPGIISELLREGTDSLGLGGKLTDIAVLFVDIRGFTTMSELLTPPQVVEILNRYLSLTTECVMKNHGTLDKFVGDCTMAIWNAPLKQDDYIMNACKAALDMVEGSKSLSEELMKTYGRTVSFGVGVHCGSAVVGNIGAEMRMDFTAIGDTVNTAARLEANAPGGQIYISRAVADALEGRIKTTSLGSSIKLKGKADGFEILTLDSLSPREMFGTQA